jgi:hypothetical protein
MPACPSLVELEDFLADRPGGATREHVRDCSRCRESLRVLRDNLAFETEIRHLLRLRFPQGQRTLPDERDERSLTR